FCMLAGQASAKVMFEPKSVVTYVFPSRANPLTPEDLPYFLLRWSPKWQRQDLAYLQKKWGLTGGGEIAVVGEPAYMRMRDFEGVIKPRIRKIPVVRDSWRLTQIAHRIFAHHYEGVVDRLDEELRRQRAAEAAR